MWLLRPERFRLIPKRGGRLVTLLRSESKSVTSTTRRALGDTDKRPQRRLWITLSGQELERVSQWRGTALALTREDQLLVDASVRLHEAVVQEDPNIRLTALGPAAGVLQTHIRRQQYTGRDSSRAPIIIRA